MLSIIKMYIETIMINHIHYWFQSSLSVILYQLSIAVYTINSNCSIIISVIIIIIISITSHQHSTILGHGNCQQSSIIGFKKGCRFPILILMQCLDTNVTFSHIVSVKHMLVSNEHQQS